MRGEGNMYRRTHDVAYHGVFAAGLLFAAVASIANAQTPSRQWISGTAGLWTNAANWDNGVPGSGTNAIITSSGATITLGTGAAANTLFVEGPEGGESELNGGDLTLADQLWINVASGTGGTILRLYDGGSTPVSVTTNKATLGADSGKQGNLILDSQAGGSVTLNVTTTLDIGYDGSGSSIYSYPFVNAGSGSVSISTNTIQVSGLSTAGVDDYNYIGTYNVNHSVVATNLNLGIGGRQGGAENYGGTWSIVNTSLAELATSGSNYITITDSGTFTNSGAFTVGTRGSDNTVFVGYTGYATDAGTLLLTGSNDLVIGFGSTADRNTVAVDFGSSLSATRNIVVGIDGHANAFLADNNSTVSSGGARLGVNALSGSNSATVSNGATWTMNGTVRVGDKGSFNSFNITGGGTVALTGSGRNFFVGYEKSASKNLLSVTGTGSTLEMSDATSDLVVSANVTGGGADATGNQIDVSNGGLLDVTRVLVGNGGTLSGNGGTVGGDTLVGAGGIVSPGAVGGLPLGSLSFLGNLDLTGSGTNGATLAIDLGASGTSDAIDVTGTLSIANATLNLTVAVIDQGPGLHHRPVRHALGHVRGDQWTAGRQLAG
jgi:fibronectin-binding autotransporter adhesin